MREPTEMVDEIEKLKPDSHRDFLGFRCEVLITHLPYEHAKPYLIESTNEEDWNPTPLEHDVILQEMRDYAEFGWGKVIGHRGLSAMRNIDKLWAYAFLLGRDDLCKEIEERSENDYAQYGAPVMAYICQQMGFPVPESEDVKRMIEGLPCEPECPMGCGA